MINLWKKLQPYRVMNDLDMPWAYQKANPAGRPYHNDWGIMSNNPILKAIQPWQKIPRIWTAYRIPLPMRVKSGEHTKHWIPHDGKYPLVPGAQIKNMKTELWDGEKVVSITLPHVEADFTGPGFNVLEAYINDEWMECFETYTSTLFGKRLLYYNGLKQDTTIGILKDGTLTSDWMTWFPEISISLA